MLKLIKGEVKHQMTGYTIRERMEVFYNVDLSQLTTEEVFQLKTKYDDYWRENNKRMADMLEGDICTLF